MSTVQCQLFSGSFLKFKVSFNVTSSKRSFLITQYNDIALSLNVSISVLCFTEFVTSFKYFISCFFKNRSLLEYNCFTILC